MNSIEELVIHHIQHPIDTLQAYELLEHMDWKEYDDSGLVSLVSYFKLDALEYDMIITMHKDNVFSLSQWKVISKYLSNRTKEIRIQSDGTNKVLHKGAKKYGGYFIEDVIIFPYNKEGGTKCIGC